MADFNIASQIQPYQAPNVLGVAEHVQKMQTSNMLMQQRAAELQKENALRAAAAQYGVNSKAYAEAAGRIDPEAGLKAFTYQRQQQAAGASAAAAGRAAELDRIRADSATVDLVNKHGTRFEQALRMVDTTENPAETYAKLFNILPPSLKPLYPDKYSPENVQRALSTNAEVVASMAPKAPTIYPGTGDMAPQAYIPGKGGALGTMSLIPETPIATNVPNQLIPPPAAAAAGTNQLAPAIAIPTTPSEMRAQAATRAQAAKIPQEQALTEARARGTAEVTREEEAKTIAKAKEKVSGTIAGIVSAYKNLAGRGELISSEGDQSLAKRAEIGLKAALPSKVTTVISPKTGGDITTIENLRRDLIPTIIEMTGAKSADAVAEMNSILNSLTTPGQTDASIVATLNNFGKKYGIGEVLSLEDLRPAGQNAPAATPGSGVPRGRRGEVPAALAPSPTPAASAGAIPPAAISQLKANPSMAPQFDEIFGAGAAARVMGR